MAVLASLFANLDYHSTSAGMGRRRRSLKLGKDEEKFKNKWHFLPSAYRNCHRSFGGIVLSRCWGRYGVGRLLEMSGNDVGNALIDGSSGVCFGGDSQNDVA